MGQDCNGSCQAHCAMSRTGGAHCGGGGEAHWGGGEAHWSALERRGAKRGFDRGESVDLGELAPSERHVRLPGIHSADAFLQ